MDKQQHLDLLVRHVMGPVAMATTCTLLLIYLYRLVFTVPLKVAGTASLPPRLPGFAVKFVRPFYTRRFGFLRDGFRTMQSSTFRFNLLNNTIIAVSGAAGRKAVLGASALDINEGFKVLSGAIPVVAGITSDLPGQTVKLIHARLGGVQTHDRLTHLVPFLLEDCRRSLGALSSTTGSFDPFTYLHEVVFQLSVRALSCTELADDAKAVARLHGLYDALDRGNTPTAILIPLSPSALLNTWRSKNIHDIIIAAIHKRQKANATGEQPPQDTLQMLLDEGTPARLIVGFMMGLIVAGSRSTGTTASWLLTFLGNHPSWRAKITSELSELASSHSTSDSRQLVSRLASVSMEDWNGHTPALDAAIRETLRLAQPHVAMRKNISTSNVNLPDGTVIPPGAFAVYPFADVHLDPSLYPDPWTWDPARPKHPSQAMAYVGWGGGNTICAGQRLARLMLKLLTATFLLSFEHETTDEAGRPAAPLPNWNDTLTCKPNETCLLRYTRRSGVEL